MLYIYGKSVNGMAPYLELAREQVYAMFYASDIDNKIPIA